MLTIYKASAGSGKTFRLVLEYLKLVLQNENNYRHILAVTFTNKATAEMKERVISQLFELASGSKNAYSDILQKELNIPFTGIQERAKNSLRNILHDYNRFSISTIDKFTQRVLKAFNRELGISPGYVLELDNEIILQEATDRLILKVNEKKDLLKWLTELGEEKIRNGSNFRIKNEILALGNELFKENFQEYFSSKDKDLYSRETLTKYNKELSSIIFSFESFLKKQGKGAMVLISENGFTVDDFTQKQRGVVGYFQKLAENELPEPNSYVKSAAEDAEKWYSKANKNIDKNAIHSLVESKLLPLLNEILNFIDKKKTDYVTAKKILANYYTLGILHDLQEEIDAIRYEKGILPISDSNLLLKKIIGNSDSPFIYEKIGNIFSHFMLDEFQDTSGMQWDNFKPLVHNSLSEGNFNLAVGDVKQSIYRWRNSDWKILAHQIESDFKNFRVQPVNLSQNWRSDGNIIQFNNSIFGKLKDVFVSAFQEKIANEKPGIDLNIHEAIQEVYNDIVQIPGNSELQGKGHTRLNFVPTGSKDDFQEKSLNLLLGQVKELQNQGYEAGDIAIIVRKNSDGLPIIQKFLEAGELPENQNYNFEIISNESLFLSSSISVNFILQIIKHLLDPSDRILKGIILNDYKNYILSPLKKIGKEKIFAEIPTWGQQEILFSAPLEYLLSEDFDTEFDSFFAPLLSNLNKELLNASVDEAIIRICEAFNLFDLEEDVPFIQALIDQAAQIKSKLTNDLSNFIKWWDDKGHKQSVNVNDDANAIRLTTIHKSKGLEFKVVLIPFFNWETTWRGNTTPTIWCKTQHKPFDALPLVPIKANKDMAESHFWGEYMNEILNNYIDNLNLIYVAFTRAKSVLMVNAPLFEKPDKNSVSQLLYDAVHTIKDTLFDVEESDELSSYGFGKINIPDRKNLKDKSIIPFGKYYFNDFNSKLKIRTINKEYFSDEYHNSNRNLGTIVHEILASINSSGDIKNACDNAFKKRIITESENVKLQNWLSELIKNKDVKDWFSGKYQILNERSLLSGKSSFRPDRIMISADEAIVVDYKTGSLEKQAYEKQVKNYAWSLKEAGLKNVSAYLWYLKTNKVEKICAL